VKSSSRTSKRLPCNMSLDRIDDVEHLAYLQAVDEEVEEVKEVDQFARLKFREQVDHKKGDHICHRLPGCCENPRKGEPGLGLIGIATWDKVTMKHTASRITLKNFMASSEAMMA
jgi:hypothetical protein